MVGSEGCLAREKIAGSVRARDARQLDTRSKDLYRRTEQKKLGAEAPNDSPVCQVPFGSVKPLTSAI